MLAASDGLSEARRKLWADALALWAAHPVVGAGPARWGVVLFAGLLVVGMVLAARSGGAAAVIGVTAWTCLAVHSSVDHLYEFWPVTLVSGLVIGLAGAGSLVVASEPGVER